MFNFWDRDLLAWLDTGTMDSLADAADFVKMIEERQGITISAPEEIAYINKWIDREKLMASSERFGKSEYSGAFSIASPAIGVLPLRV